MPKCAFTITMKKGVPLYVTLDGDKKQKQYAFIETDIDDEYYTEFKCQSGIIGVFYNYNGESKKVYCNYIRGICGEGYEPDKSLTLKEIE